MKQVCVHYVLAAFLLAVIAVPVVGNVAKTADRSPGRAVQAPIVTANVFPTPWPCTGKSCKSVAGEMPTVTADANPVPWPCTGKSCKSVVVEMPTVVADAWPTPWPKKPGLLLG